MGFFKLKGTGVLMLVAALILITPFSLAAWTENLNEGLVVYWNFEQLSGDLTDIVAGQLNGTLQNVTNRNVTGIVGTAYNFTDIDDSRIVVATGPGELKGQQKYSFNFWVRRTGTHNTTTRLFESDKTSGSNWGIEEFDATTGNFRYIDQNQNQQTFINESALPVEVWQMFTFTYNGSDQIMYIDGSFNNEVNGGSMGNATGDFFIGDFIYTGLIDEVAFWNRTINSSEVSQLYNDGLGITYEIQTPLPENGTFYNVTVDNHLSIEGNLLTSVLGMLVPLPSAGAETVVFGVNGAPNNKFTFFRENAGATLLSARLYGTNQTGKGGVAVLRHYFGVGTDNPGEYRSIGGDANFTIDPSTNKVAFSNYYPVLHKTDTPSSCTGSFIGASYFDTSLSEPCFCNGTSWREYDSLSVC